MSIDDLEADIRGRDTEVAAAFDANGKLLFAPKVGTDNTVSFHEHEIGLFNDAVVTHNHPQGSAPSGADLALAALADAAAIRAVGKFGDFESKRPASGWPDPYVVESAGTRALNRANAETYVVMSQYGKKGVRPTQEELEEHWMELTLKYMQEEMGKIGIEITFSRI
jgi:hypothetical protein